MELYWTGVGSVPFPASCFDMKTTIRFLFDAVPCVSVRLATERHRRADSRLEMQDRVSFITLSNNISRCRPRVYIPISKVLPYRACLRGAVLIKNLGRTPLASMLIDAMINHCNTSHKKTRSPFPQLWLSVLLIIHHRAARSCESWRARMVGNSGCPDPYPPLGICVD